MRTPRPTFRQLLRTPLLWLALLYILVGLMYARVTPVLEKPDEEGHYGYLLYLREHHALPPLSSEQGLLSEFKQPPLYYVVTAAITGWLPDASSPDRLFAVNPYMYHSVPGHRNDNRNVFLHPPDMTPLVFAARLVSLFFGLGGTICSYFLALQLFPRGSLVPITSAALYGFHSKLLYMATAVNNDAAFNFLATLVVTLLLVRLQKGSFSAFPTLVGAALGFASITKVSGLVLLPLVGFALLFIHRGFRPALLRDGAAIMAVALIIGGWWYARNALVYGDPLTMAAHAARADELRGFWDRLGRDLLSVEHTFWANHSRTFVSLTRLDRVFIWWGRVSLGVLAYVLLLGQRSIRAQFPASIILLSWPAAFMLLLMAYWTRRASWAYGRFLFPALAPTIVLLVVGWRFALPTDWRRSALTLITGFGVFAGCLVPLVDLYPLYHPWREPRPGTVEHPIGTLYSHPDTGEKIARLLGLNLLEPHGEPGTYTPIELCWDPLGHTDVPYALIVQLLDLSQLRIQGSPGIWGRRETYPGLGNLPTDRWRLHRPFCDTVSIWIFPETPTPTSTVVEVGFIDPETRRRLRAVGKNGEPASLASSIGLAVLSTADLPAEAREELIVFDDAIGLEQPQVTVAPDHTVGLTLTWQSLRPVPYDATMFAHLRRPGGEALAQIDRQPLNGRFPTSYWVPGQLVTDVLSLGPVSSTVDGPLTLNIGLYTWPSLERLSARDSDGNALPDNIVVASVPWR